MGAPNIAKNIEDQNSIVPCQLNSLGFNYSRSLFLCLPVKNVSFASLVGGRIA
jgi:hypothetical protein